MLERSGPHKPQTQSASLDTWGGGEIDWKWKSVILFIPWRLLSIIIKLYGLADPTVWPPQRVLNVKCFKAFLKAQLTLSVCPAHFLTFVFRGRQGSSKIMCDCLRILRKHNRVMLGFPVEVEVSDSTLSDLVGFTGKGRNRILKDLQEWEPEAESISKCFWFALASQMNGEEWTFIEKHVNGWAFHTLNS